MQVGASKGPGGIIKHIAMLREFISQCPELSVAFLEKILFIGHKSKSLAEVLQPVILLALSLLLAKTQTLELQHKGLSLLTGFCKIFEVRPASSSIVNYILLR